jgi:integrative and conjugative element protein (TIGR02256 family)
MKLLNKHRKVDLIFKDSLLDEITKIALENYPNECGGFLVGYYSKDFITLNITDFILPKKQKSTAFLFERSVFGIKEIFNKLFILKQHYYIGEWHTHPNGSSMYSQTDLKAMIEIVNCETVNITNPLLLILSINKNKLQDFSFYIYDNKGLHRYE